MSSHPSVATRDPTRSTTGPKWFEKLQQNPTPRYMLGKDANQQITELRASVQVDIDDILMGQGFTLLRFTGQLI